MVAAMTDPSVPSLLHGERRELRCLFLWSLVGWSLLLLISLGMSLREAHQSAEQHMYATARAAFNKDQAFRLWMSSIGGVYVDRERHRESPYLAHITDRDISLPNGRHLTLINPATLLQSTMDRYPELYGAKARVSGLVALNPNNVADPWEARAIEAFGAGQKEMTEIVGEGSQRRLRLMRPMYTEASCLKCHGHQGFEVGQILGGVGVTLPTAEFDLLARRNSTVALGGHAVIWLAGVIALLLFYNRFARLATERARSVEALAEAAHVFDSTLQAVMITDDQNRIVRVNAAFSEFTGYTIEEAAGQSPALLDSRHHDEAFWKAFHNQLNTEGCWQGEIWNRRANGEVFVCWQSVTTVFDGSGRVAKRISVFRDITEEKAASDRVRALAHFDALTALPNRQLLADRVQHALERLKRENGRLAMLFIDLDHFKKVNDTLGHFVGDEVLREAAERIAACLRGADTVARLGGDEFAVLLENVESQGAVQRVAQKLVKALAQPVHVEGREVFLGASIGIVVSHDPAVRFQALLSQADMAMYEAKRHGRGRWHIYSPELGSRAARRVELEAMLRQAIDNGELCVHYQPQFDARTRRLVSAEALARWLPPEGSVSPGEFIPVAEESGLIIAIGDFVLDSACRQVAAWRREGWRDARVAVNVSLIQLRQGGFVDSVRRSLGLHALPPEALELEITESAAMHDVDQHLGWMGALAKLGVVLTIDDFGTGYSSLSQLRRLPVQTLKIDRSFVDELPDNAEDVAVVNTVLSLARTLRLNVVAEGTETEAQCTFLTEAGCDYLQGFYLARPMPPEELARYWVT